MSSSRAVIQEETWSEFRSSYVSELEELDPNYNIWDDEFFDLDSIIEVYLQNNKITHQIESIKKAKQVTLSIDGFVIKEKEAGKSNLQIIQAIIDQHKQGVLSIPKHKINQYHNILTLSNQTANTPDQNYIEEIINGSETDLLDEGSFENIIFQIYEDGRISAETKVIIEQQFNIKPIHTGGDLKRALEDRNKLIEQHDIKLDH